MSDLQGPQLEKKLKKVIEQIIIDYEEYFIDSYGEDFYKIALKHKSKISNMAIQDDDLKALIREQVEDFIGIYLISLPSKPKKQIREYKD